MTRKEWATKFLRQIGAPRTTRNLRAVVAWIQAEGSEAEWNPLATTKKAPGSTEFNWVGVQNYPDAETGLRATAETLNYGADRDLYGYRPIRHRLRKSRSAYWTLRAVEVSAWGTGGLALECLPWVKKAWEHYSQMTVPE